jgi:hypothetical protein
MNPHLHSQLIQTRLAQLERGAERHRREAIVPTRTRRFARSRRPQVLFARLRPSLRHA